MARIKTGQMSLYEAVDHARFKAAQGRELDRVANGEVPHQPGQVFGEKLNIPPKTAPAAVKTPSAAPAPAKVAASPVAARTVVTASAPQAKTNIWVKKPAMLQLNNGRIEAFLPYPVAGIALLVVLVLLLMFYHLGTTVGRSRAMKAIATGMPAADSETVVAQTRDAARKMAQISTTPVRKPAIEVAKVPAVDSSTQVSTTGAFVVVLKEMSDSRNLAPVKEFFDKNGIPTEIRRGGASYFLVTKERFESTGTGTPLDAMKKRIAQVGRNYKAPPGYGNFGPKMFNDAYGRKLN